MSCCGQARRQAGMKVSSGSQSAVTKGTVVFEYIGRTALTVIGSVSGIKYRFDHPGARLTVDARDRDSLDQGPMLKQVG